MFVMGDDDFEKRVGLPAIWSGALESKILDPIVEEWEANHWITSIFYNAEDEAYWAACFDLKVILIFTPWYLKTRSSFQSCSSSVFIGSIGPLKRYEIFGLFMAIVGATVSVNTFAESMMLHCYILPLWDKCFFKQSLQIPACVLVKFWCIASLIHLYPAIW